MGLGFAIPWFLVPGLVFAGESPRLVKSVAVPGTTLEVKLATQAGQPYDNATVARDVHFLWSLGGFDDIRVEASDDPDGIAIVFRARAAVQMTLHEIFIEPSTFGIQIKAPEGSHISRLEAERIAERARNQLVERGYPEARVTYEFAPCGNEVDLKLTVDQGQEVAVKQVDFTGEPALNTRELRGALQELRSRRLLPAIPHVWGGWQLWPRYSRQAMLSDAARLQSFYLAKRYFDAVVQPDEPEVSGTTAKVAFRVQAGPRYDVRQWSVESRSGEGWKPTEVCSALFAERRNAEQQGILDFSVTMNVPRAGGATAEVAGAIQRGTPYRVGRIDFIGNHRFSDSSIRRNFQLDEGAPLDERVLRRSLARLNHTGRFEGIDEKNVIIARNEKTGVADIKVRLAERKFGQWNLSGPVGPASLAGPLEASISARLPAWGRGLFELSTYTVSLSAAAFVKPIVPALGLVSGTHWPVVSLNRPFSAGDGWLSGFAIAPQIGWRGSGFRYGITTLEQRLLPLLAGDRGIVPELPVTVDRPSGEAVMMCEPPNPRLYPLRAGTGVAFRLAASLASF